MYNSLYTYDDYIHLVYDDKAQTCITKDNRNMHDEIIKVHRGVDNQLLFKVYNRDRRPQSVRHQRIRARLFNVQNSELILERYLDQLSDTGALRLDILEADLVDIPEGYYSLVITGGRDLTPGTVGHEIQTPFFTDQDNNATIDVEVTGQIQIEPRESISITAESWTPIQIPKDRPAGELAYRSSALPSGRLHSYTHSIHTMSIHCENYTGRIRFYGSIEDVPGDNLQGYFPIAIGPNQTEVVFENHTGTVPIVIQANFMWLKLERIDAETNSGSVYKILSRS
jgi:hypothetical protein